MSDESKKQDHDGSRTRPLRGDEIELLRALLVGSPLAAAVRGDLSTWLVEQMDDGGMGSLKFVQKNQEGPRKFGEVVALARYIDADEVEVSIEVNVDTNGQLYELDIWKVDFAPLKRYPRPADLLMLPA